MKRPGLSLLGFLVTISLLVYLGPFGTWDSLDFFDRLMFWATAVSANWLIAELVFSFTIRGFAARKWPHWAGLVLAGLISALPGTAMVWMVVAAYLDVRLSGVFAILGLYGQVLVLHLAIGSMVVYVIRRSLQRSAAAVGSPPDGEADTAQSQPPPEPALFSRLPPKMRTEILHLRMQDHYVEVHTAVGMELLLLRFRDALSEVEGVDGLRVHRSHWVARAAVAGVERRRGGRVALRLVNGSEVPVSRSFAPALKAQGWI